MTFLGYVFVVLLLGIIGYNGYKLFLQIRTHIHNKRNINNNKGGNAD